MALGGLPSLARGSYPVTAVKVLYIAGTGRSGSTLLDNMLGQLPGFFSAGELRFIWERNVVADRICGCGKPFSACPVWCEVMTRFHAQAPGVAAPDLVTLRESALRLRTTPLTLTDAGTTRLRARNTAYLTMLHHLYHCTAEVTGARVIVDSSKYPSYGYLLGLGPGMDVRVVHLVRDPRAVAHSWMRRQLETRALGDIQPMGTRNPAATAYSWTLWNLLIETYALRRRDRYLRLRYEDFVTSPREWLAAIADHVGEPAGDLAAVHEDAVSLQPNHTVGGNPARMRSGRVVVRADNEWMTHMRSRDRAVVTTLSAPLLHRYGYTGPVPGMHQEETA